MDSVFPCTKNTKKPKNEYVRATGSVLAKWDMSPVALRVTSHLDNTPCAFEQWLHNEFYSIACRCDIPNTTIVDWRRVSKYPGRPKTTVYFSGCFFAFPAYTLTILIQ